MKQCDRDAAIRAANFLEHLGHRFEANAVRAVLRSADASRQLNSRLYADLSELRAQAAPFGEPA